MCSEVTGLVPRISEILLQHETARDPRTQTSGSSKELKGLEIYGGLVLVLSNTIGFNREHVTTAR
jgi:hypothetical protein